MEHIRSFGRFNIDNYKFYADPTFAIEDYICPDVDHELMYKCLQGLDDEEPRQESKAIDGDGVPVLRLNEKQTVRMTVEQRQELLDHQSNSLRKFELFMSNEADLDANNPRKMVLGGNDEKIAQILIDNLNGSQNEVETIRSSTELEPSAKISVKKSKRKIKINQYSGTINLKNISNLTINTTCSRDSPKLNHKSIQMAEKSPSSEDQPTWYGCDFYNRLINEIKQTIDSTSSSPTTSSSTNKTSPTTPSSNSFSSGSTPTTSPPFDCNRMLFQNIRHHPTATAARSSLLSTSGTDQLPDPDKAVESDEQPVQIEQWLKQIITQTELEPVPPSVEILEHSLIKNNNTRIDDAY